MIGDEIKTMQGKLILADGRINGIKTVLPAQKSPNRLKACVVLASLMKTHKKALSILVYLLALLLPCALLPAQFQLLSIKH